MSDSVRWSPAQQEVIRHRQGNLLVSAAAGAGKTAVLVERIFQMITEPDGTGLDRLLIVTFTDLAASQMKERIYERLSAAIEERPEDPRLHQQLALISQSSIMTIHAFCLSVVRRCIARIPGLDPAFRVGDANEMTLLALDVLSDTLEDAYDRMESDPEHAESVHFRALLHQFSGNGNDQKLENTLYSLYTALESVAGAEEWLNRAVEAHQHDPLYPALLGVKETLRHFEKAYQREKRRMSVVDYADFERFALRILLDADQEPTADALAIRNDFDYIFIDEYQDSNDLQEKILNAVARRDEGGQVCNLFMVGDIKQSIYGFRGARPALFEEKLQTYFTDRNPKKLFLQQNFRSRPEILDSVNYFFESLLQPSTGGITYDETQALSPGRTLSQEEAGHSMIPSLYVLQKSPDSPDEPAFAAMLIAQMLSHAGDYSVGGKEGLHPLQPGDIAILTRTSVHHEDFRKALEKKGIPVSVVLSQAFFGTPEVSLALNLLRIIDNPRQDIPLQGVLHSTLFGFTSADFAHVRINTPKGLCFYEALLRFCELPDQDALGQALSAFLDQLEKWRGWSQLLSIPDFLQRLYESSGLYEYAGALKDGSHARANLRQLILCAQTFEEGIYSGLFHFLRYIDRMLSRQKDLEQAPKASAAQSVTLMTIHKSKGLEFPVVILADLGHLYSGKKKQPDILMHPRAGLAFHRVDDVYPVRLQNEAYDQVKKALEEDERAEELRILYVAMTRARDRLYLTGTLPAKAAPLLIPSSDETPYLAGSEQVLSASSALMLLLDVWQHKGGNRIQVFPPDALPQWAFSEPSENAQTQSPGVLVSRTSEEKASAHPLDTDLLWKYPYAYRNEMQAAVSVSALKQSIAAAEDDVLFDRLLEEVPMEQTEAEPAPALFRGAYGGTLFHRVLAECSLEELAREEELPELIARLRTEGFLSEEEAAHFPLSWIRRFTASTIFARMRQSELVFREEAYLAAYTPDELRALVPSYPLPKEARDQEQILVQGIPDLLFQEPDGWVLVDYKTDRSLSAPNRAMYALQLQLYSDAIHRSSGIPVKEKLLYLVRSGEIHAV